MIPHVLILGGGFGGISAALTLRAALPATRLRITVIDRKDWFMVGFAKLWIIQGRRTFAESTAPLSNLAKYDIEFVKTEVTGVDTTKNLVRTACGSHPYDYLVVALGARLSPTRVPGLAQNGMNLYSVSQSEVIRDRLSGIKSGSIAIAIAGMPYKCPPAPYEAALMIDAMLRESGVRHGVDIDVYSPAPITLPAAGAQVSGQILEMINSAGINFHPSYRMVSVEPNRINFEEGAADFDVLLAIPPHTLPEAVSALAGGGDFIKIDRFGRTAHNGVYAAGDVTVLPAGRAAVPKAGVFAEGEGVTIAAHILHTIGEGPPPEQFDGRGGCFIESGPEKASVIRVDAFAPSTVLEEASAENLSLKVKFERDRLDGWLGGL